MIGQRIGNYFVIGEIGFWGMGAVYKAENRRSGRTVALKILKEPRDEGEILPEKGGWRLSEEGRWGKPRLSAHAVDLVRRRIHRLPKEARRVLDIAAVEGKHFSPNVLSEVLGMRKVDLLRMLNELERTYGLIGPRSGGYGFQHAYIREALYEDLSGAYRTETIMSYASCAGCPTMIED